jgi:carboxymethylenebutenolidase
MAELHQDDSPVASPAAQDVDPDLITTESVTYGQIGTTDLQGYLAQPKTITAQTPGLIVIQEWWGLNENIRTMTRRLAAEGYVALAVDLYEGQVADTPDQARTLVQEALENPQGLQENVVSAYRFLANERQVEKVGSIGWCFGGTWSLNTALALPTELDATVIYYGGQITTDPMILEPLQMPIQGHFGALDTSPSPATVTAFATALEDLNKVAEIYQYEGAGHAFANPSGTRYNPAAAALAWERTLDFLSQHLS